MIMSSMWIWSSQGNVCFWKHVFQWQAKVALKYSGSTLIKPVPAPRGRIEGESRKEPSVSDNCRIVQLLFQNAGRQFVCCPYKERWNVTKVCWLMFLKTNFLFSLMKENLSPQMFACRAKLIKVRNCSTVLSQTREHANRQWIHHSREHHKRLVEK